MNQDPALKEKLKEQGKTLMAAAKAAGAAVTVKSGSFERAAAPVEPITPINAAMGPAASRLVTGQETSKVFDKINKMRRGRF